MPDERPADALREVRARLDDAHAAADRLVQEAQREAEEASGERPARVPRSGWDAGQGDAATLDPRALLTLLDALRAAVPPDLSRQLVAALRDLLLALRALIDWYLERLGEPAADRGEVEVEDIPLD